MGETCEGDSSADGAAEMREGDGKGRSRALVMIVQLRVVPSHDRRLVVGGLPGRSLK